MLFTGKCIVLDLKLGFPGDHTVVKSLPANAGDLRGASSIPGSGRSPGEANGNPLQYSRLGNHMDTGAWQAAVHRVAQSHTRLKQLNTHRLKGIKYSQL